ncbi:MAG: ATP-binding protein [Pseudomonadota bacterium]
MSFVFKTASERRAERSGVKAAIFGPSGIGKTTLLKTLPADETLFFDLEAGDLAVEDWDGVSMEPRTWKECRDLAVAIAGPDPALPPDACYSQAHYDAVMSSYEGNPFDKFRTIFVDSITVAGRLCFTWCRQQPESHSEKTGKPDVRGTYGLHGREMMGWLTHLQHARGKDVVFVGILEAKTDDYGRTIHEPQIEGSKTGRELPGIVDQVITMTAVKPEEGDPFRAFVCQTVNPWSYPAKDRSGRLDLLEKPHLGELFAKIRGARPERALNTDIPTNEAA